MSQNNQRYPANSKFQPQPAPLTEEERQRVSNLGAGSDNMQTDMAASAEQQKAEERRRRVEERRRKRAEEQNAESQPKLGSESRQEWQPNALPEGNEILRAGLEAMGYQGDAKDLRVMDFDPNTPDLRQAMEKGFDVLGVDKDAYERRAWGQIKSAAGAVKDDVGAAVTDPVGTASQVPGGLIDAWNEINRFGASLDVLAGETLGYWPALQIFDKEGNISPAILNAADPEVAERLKGEDNLFIANNPIEADDTVTGNLIRGISQFAAPFAAGNKALKGIDALAKPGAWRELSRYALAGIATDFTAFNPEMERLTDMMDEAGFPVIEYLKSDEDDSEWESRFKNAVEGGVIGLFADAVFQTARAMKGTQKVQQGLMERVRAQEAEESTITTEIERDLWANGDPQGPAVEFDAPPKAETQAARTERLAQQERPEPVTSGDQYFDKDFFELEPDVKSLGDNKPAVRMGDAVADRRQFTENETVVQSTDQGDLIGFSARSGDFGVAFQRGPEGTVVDFDRLDNLISDQPFKKPDGSTPRTQAESLRDANEVFSKVAAVIEADSIRTGSPSYTITPATIVLDKFYQRMLPKLADRMGYDYRMTEGGFLLTRPEATTAFKQRGEHSIFEAVSPEDRAARRQVGGKVREFLNDETGYSPEIGTTPINRAAEALERQLESRRARFAFDDAGPQLREMSGADSRQRLDDIRAAGREAFPKEFDVLEADGRIQYARRPSDVDPNWADLDTSAQAVTSTDGKVTIFTQNTKPDEVAGLMLHEMGIHAGMRGMVGDAGMNALTKRIDDLISEGDPQVQRALDRVPPSTPEPKVLEEVMAYLVQYAPKSSVTQEIVSKVKAWAAKTNPKLIKRLKLKENDYRNLAMLAIRNEAILSGEVVAVFGRLPRIEEVGRETQTAKPMFNLTQSEPELLLTERLALGNAMPVRQALDFDAEPAALGQQVAELQDELLGPGFTERLFEADEAFDPFLWRDTVEALASGDVRPVVVDEFKRMADTIEVPAKGADEPVQNSLFSIKTGPGRLDDALNRTVLDDVKTGRRGLEPQEAEALIGAADRWAQSVARLQPQRGRDLVDVVEQIKGRNDPDDMRYLIELMEGAKAQVKEPPSLLTFLRSQGGIQDAGGELAARDLGRVKFTNNKSGLTMDEALERAWEAGYFAHKPMEGDTLGPGARPADETRPTHSELLDLIDRELGGESVYSINDLSWVQEAAARQDMRAELDRLGVDPSLPRAQIASEFERIAMLQEGEPVTLRDIEDIDAMERLTGAKPGVGLPNRDLLGGNRIRINFNALQTSDDIRSLIGQLADSFADEIDAARGGTRTNQDIIKDSRKLSAWEALNERADGTALKDTEVPAAQALYLASAENVKKALKQAMETGSDTAHYAARRALVMHRAIQAEIAGAKADASRALRAWSVTQSATAQARRELNDVMERYGGRLDPEEAARLESMIDDNPLGFDRATRQMGRHWADVGGTVLRFAFLSGPPTHIMNFVSNTLVAGYDIGTRLITGVRGTIARNPEMAEQLGVAMKEYIGFIAGVQGQFKAFGKKADYGRMGRRLQEARDLINQGQTKQGLMRGASALAFDNPVSAMARGRFDDRGVSGRDKYADMGNDRAISAEAFGVQQGTAYGRVLDGLGAVLSAPVEFLGFADDFFKGSNELATRYRMAQEMVYEELRHGLDPSEAKVRFRDIVENPPQGVIDEAKRSAQRRTFTEPVGQATRMVLTAREWLNGTGFPLGHILLPFVVTPSNILKFAFQNGPTGILFKEIRAEMAAGGVRRANAQARMMAGTGLLMWGMHQVAEGTMTGRGPQDPGERELWQRSGRQEYSIKVGDKWVSYRRLEPVSTMIAIGADLQMINMNRALDDDPEEDFGELLGPILGAAINVVTSKTYLTSMTEFIRFTEDSERYGPNYVDKLVAAVGAPAAASTVEKITDPQLREASSAVERWMSRMPGLSENVPVAKDLWGRDRHISSGLGNWYDALSPFSIRTEKAEPIDAELLRIGYYPTRPDKSLVVQTQFGPRAKVNIRNRPDIYTRYVELAGNDLKIFDGMGAKDYLNAVIDGKHPHAATYQRLSDSPLDAASKERFIRRTMQTAREAAQNQIVHFEFRRDLQEMAQASITAQRESENVLEELNNR